MTQGELRAFVTERARGCCAYCLSQRTFSPDDFALEHIVPKALGGTDDVENIALSCQGCNNRKYTVIDAIDPVTGARVSLYHPRQDTWGDHFAWSADALHMIALTPTGRATVARLELNRAGVVNLRWALLIAGVHPPF